MPLKEAAARVELLLVGSGLAKGLIALRLSQLRPEVRVVVLEAGDRLGGTAVDFDVVGSAKPTAGLVIGDLESAA